MSETLRVLKSFGLVELANPEARKGRIYEISDEGVRALRLEIPVPER